jgi:hypothetical protein
MRPGTRLLLGSVVSIVIIAQANAQSRHPPRRVSPPTRANTVKIVNHTDQKVIEAYASLQSDTEWGDERLSETAIPPGGSRTLTPGLGKGCTYQVHVVYENTTSEDGDVDGCGARTITFDGTQVPSDLKDSHDVVLVNQSGQKLESIYLVTSRRDNWRSDGKHWGQDLLGSGKLAVGESKTLPVLGCSADLAVNYEGRSADDERKNIDVCKNPTIIISAGWTSRDPVGTIAAGPVDNGQASVNVINKTGKTISNLHAYPDGSDEQGDDLLGSGFLDDGATKTVSITLGSTCKFTLETSGGGAGTRTRGGIDLCAKKQVTLTASGHPEASFRNAGPLPVVALYVDAPGAPQGPDRLADGVVVRGGNFTLVLPDEARCDYQVTAVFRDGRTVARSSNICGGDDTVLN